MQVLKIAMVTIQLIFFGLSNQMVVAFKEENTIAFKHLFLKGYVDQMDDTYAVYTQSDVYDRIVFAVNQYLQLRSISVGNHAYENKGAEQSAMAICWHFYKQGNICPGNDTFDVDPEVKTECFFVEPDEAVDTGTLEENKLNLTLDFHRLLTVELQFKLKAINLQTIRHHELPDCYDFTLTVSVGWAGFRSCLEKKSCISIDVSSLVCVHRLCPRPTHTHREALVQLLLWFVVH